MKTVDADAESDNNAPFFRIFAASTRFRRSHAMTLHQPPPTAHHHLTSHIRSANDKLALLRTIAIFDHLSAAQAALLAAELHVCSFSRRETIFRQGDPGNMLYLIARGQVRIYHPGARGCELSVAILRAGEFFGELALLDDQPRSASAEAMCPTTTLTLTRYTFHQLLRACVPVAEALVMELVHRMRTSTTYAAYLANPSAQQRVGWLVLDLAQRYGVPSADGIRIALDLTQDDLASMIGVTRETINRALMQLRDQQLLRLVDRQLVVPDCARLTHALALA
jgi:CRP/FNR family transcriptional regulator, cyclic AMP receptor protein